MRRPLTLSRPAAFAYALVMAAGAAFIGIRASAQPPNLTAQTQTLLEAASLEPVELTLSADRISTTREDRYEPSPYLPAHNRLTLRLPAAYVNGIGFREPGPDARQIGLAFWYPSMDPYRPDEMADLAACRAAGIVPCVVPERPGSRMAARRLAGETRLSALIFNQPGVETARWHSIRYAAGLIGGPGGTRPPPCTFTIDATLGLLVGRTPDGRRGRACNAGWDPYTHTRTGIIVEQATFFKADPEGTPRFSVVCPEYVTAEMRAAGVPATNCTIYADFGIWPLRIGVPSDRAQDWNAMFERVQEFLTRHVVARTD